MSTKSSDLSVEQLEEPQPVDAPIGFDTHSASDYDDTIGQASGEPISAPVQGGNDMKERIDTAMEGTNQSQQEFNPFIDQNNPRIRKTLDLSVEAYTQYKDQQERRGERTLQYWDFYINWSAERIALAARPFESDDE